MKLLKRFWALGLLFSIEIILFATNYHPGTTLLGWDGLYPEFNFPVNLERNLFSVWQEYRGVGLYDGMSYASNLGHTLFLWLLSFALPQDVLRYFFIFLMHAVGVVGMYLLLHKLLKEKVVSVVGALFYGFNLGIIQLFYAPLEVFAIHFAFLPILLLSLFSFLQFPTWKKLSIFALFSFLATPQGFVPQIFISYLFLVFSVLGIYFFVNRKMVLPVVLKVLGVIFCINAFWLLPYLYGIPHNASVIMNSKINQMASNKIYLMNQERGNLLDVLTMKGFMLDTAEYTNEQYTYIMKEWRAYTATPLFIVPSILFVLIMVYGLFVILWTRNLGFYPFIFTGVLSFFFLGNDVWGLNILNAVLRFLLPVFNEAFRFPFTKFETLFAFSYTVLFAVGVQQLLHQLTSKENITRLAQLFQHAKQRWAKKKRVKRFITRWEKPTLQFLSLHGIAVGIWTISILLFFYELPVFEGHFLYDSVRIKMEPEYKDILSFLETQPSTNRIATLPQPTFYNWEYYQNNYRGSGFLWYGIPQATLDRSFDPWSNYNENYYWELSQALYAKDPDALKSVFAKYQVGIILLDENLIYPFAPRTLQIPETKDMLSKIGAKEVKHVGKVTVYELPSSPLFSADQLPTVNSYTWADSDAFYQSHGNYIASNNANIIFPFRTLFSNRSQKELPVTPTENNTTITLSSTLPAGTSHITLPSFTSLESFIQGDLVYEGKTREVSLLLKTPQIAINGQPISGENLSYPLFTLPESPAFPLTFSVNNQQSVTLKNNVSQTLGTFLLPVDQNTYISVSDSQNGNLIAELPKEKILDSFSKPVSISLTGANTSFPLTISLTKPHTVFSPQLSSTNVTNCDNLSSSGTIHVAKTGGNAITLSALHADACMSFFDPQAQSNQGYLLSITTNHLEGEPLAFWAEDLSEQYSFLYTQLPSTHTTSYFFLPPREKYNLGYSFHIENISTGEQLTLNQVGTVSFSPIPYNFLTHIIADTGKNLHAVTTKDAVFTHPNPSLYNVTADFSQMDSPTLVLSQAYDAGWHAYTVSQEPSTLIEILPFFFGKELTDHVKVNNWENGWRIPNNSTNNSHIVIVFLPQYIEYLGMLLLCGTGIFLALTIIPIPQRLPKNPFKNKLFLKKKRLSR